METTIVKKQKFYAYESGRTIPLEENKTYAVIHLEKTDSAEISFTLIKDGKTIGKGIFTPKQYTINGVTHIGSLPYRKAFRNINN